MLSQLEPVLVNALGTVLAAAITAAAAMLVAYLAKLRSKAQAEISKVQTEDQKIFIENVLDTIMTNLSAAVDKMEVTMVKEIKRATGDGKLTKEDQVKIANAAMDLCAVISGDEMMSALESIVGDTEAYLLTMIDSMVLQKKVTGNDLNAAQAIDAQAMNS